MASKTTKPLHQDLDGMPWRMLPAAKAYLRLIADEGEQASKIAGFALVSLAKDLDKQGVGKWEDVEPAHYEAWVRRRHEATLNASPMEREVFCGCHARMDEFFCGLEAMGKIPSNPADGMRVSKSGVVTKRKDSNPALDLPIRDFLNENYPDSDSQAHAVARGSLRAVAGAMLARGINEWSGLTAEKLDEMAKEWVEESRAAGKPTAQSIQNRIRAIRVFGDYMVAKGLTKANPADEVTVAASGRVTMPKDHDPKMYAQAQDFVASLYDDAAASTHVQIAQNATRVTRFMCGECGLQEWQEVSPAHYVAYLKETWSRNPNSPAGAMFNQSTTRKLLKYLKAKQVIDKDPSEDIRFNMKGELTMGHDHREQLPRGPGQAGMLKLRPLRDMDAGFARDAMRYHAKMTKAGMMSSLIRVATVLPEVAEMAKAQGCQGWADIERPLLVEYGKKQFADHAPATAAMKISVVRSFFNHLDQSGAIPGNPIYGVKIIGGRQLTEPSKAPTPAMEREVHGFVRNIKPGADMDREDSRNELFRLGGELAAKGRTTWAEVTREDLVEAVRAQAPGQAKRARLQSVERLRLFYADLTARKVVESDPIKGVRADTVFEGIPSKGALAGETGMSLPAPGALRAPTVPPPAEPKAPLGPDLG